MGLHRSRRLRYVSRLSSRSEVLSPSTQRLGRVRKLPVYAEVGVAVAWLVHPTDRTLEVFTLEGDRLERRGLHRSPALVGLSEGPPATLELGELWPLPPPPSAGPRP